MYDQCVVAGTHVSAIELGTYPAISYAVGLQRTGNERWNESLGYEGSENNLECRQE